MFTKKKNFYGCAMPIASVGASRTDPMEADELSAIILSAGRELTRAVGAVSTSMSLFFRKTLFREMEKNPYAEKNQNKIKIQEVS